MAFLAQLVLGCAEPVAGKANVEVDVDVLRRLYEDEGRTLAETAAALGRSTSGVRKLLVRHGVRRRKYTAPRLRDDGIDVDNARRLYEDGLSLRQVADKLDTTADKVVIRLRRAGVELRRPGAPGGRLRALDRDWLVQAYVGDRGDIAAIAAMSNCSPAHVRDELRRLGIRRTRQAVLPEGWLALNADVLHQLYVVEQLTTAEVAAKAGGSQARVLAALRRAGIPARPPGTRRGHHLVAATPEVLHQLYVVEGLSCDGVARRLGGESERIRLALVRAGIPRRPAGTTAATLVASREQMVDMYVTKRMSIAEIAADQATTANQVRLRLRAERIRRPPARRPPPPPPADEVRSLYVEGGVTLNQLARRYHVGREHVRRWLADAGVSVAPRTSRASRRLLPTDELERAYWDEGCSASDLAARFGTTMDLVLRCLHDGAVPVRVGFGQPEAMCVLDQLYGDGQIRAVLRRYRVAPVRAPGPIADRFPEPAALSPDLLRSLYTDVGLAARHIELLTGQPEEQILDALHLADIEVRTFGSPSPWRQRQLRRLRRPRGGRRAGTDP